MGDLLNPFMSFASFRTFCENLIENTDNPAVALFALEGIYSMERGVESGQGVHTEGIEDFLRKWRNETPMSYSRQDTFGRGKIILKNLTIFKTLKVPLFIDDLGTKTRRSSFEATEPISIDRNTPIFHVTHSENTESIIDEQRIQGSANKNSIKGCWFGLDDPEQNDSVYGSRAFETTLFKLGVTGVRQGEIVSYKNEVNVILYAHGLELADFEVFKPTDVAAKNRMNPNAYVKVSIFVPEEFLPGSDIFSEVIDGPFEVTHGPFCVKKKRGSHCPDESDPNESDESDESDPN